MIIDETTGTGVIFEKTSDFNSRKPIMLKCAWTVLWDRHSLDHK